MAMENVFRPLPSHLDYHLVRRSFYCNVQAKSPSLSSRLCRMSRRRESVSRSHTLCSPSPERLYMADTAPGAHFLLSTSKLPIFHGDGGGTMTGSQCVERNVIVGSKPGKWRYCTYYSGRHHTHMGAREEVYFYVCVWLAKGSL